jgi:hypothetical protein
MSASTSASASASASTSTSTNTLRPFTPSKPPATSSSSGPLHSHGQGDGSFVRGRTTSSAFTVKGEVKPLMDLVVAEVVADSKVYVAGTELPEDAEVGYYVEVKARKRDGKVSPLSSAGPLGTVDATAKGISGDSATSSELLASWTSGEEELPFVYTIHTMPSSPLHSSGLHLLPIHQHTSSEIYYSSHPHQKI